MKLTRRYSHGLTVLGAYTFSKSTDNGSGIRTNGTDPLNPQNSYCLSCEDGPSVFDQRHRFVTSVVYDPPVGPERRYLSDGGLGDGDWRMENHVRRHARLRFSADRHRWRGHREYRQLLPSESRRQRDTTLDDATIDRWFNTTAYSRAAHGTFGTAGRSEISGPGLTNWDFSLLREFHFATGRPYLEFRAEAFNVLNHPNWGEPNTTLSNVAFGRISATRTDMRQLQFGLKFVF